MIDNLKFSVIVDHNYDGKRLPHHYEKVRHMVVHKQGRILFHMNPGLSGVYVPEFELIGDSRSEVAAKMIQKMIDLADVMHASGTFFIPYRGMMQCSTRVKPTYVMNLGVMLSETFHLRKLSTVPLSLFNVGIRNFMTGRNLLDLKKQMKVLEVMEC